MHVLAGSRAKRFSRALALATKAQARFDNASIRLADAATAREIASAAIPEQPSSPFALAGGRRYLAAVVLLFVALEAYLSFPTLQLLALSDAATRRLCIVIGLSFALGAELIGPLLVYIVQQAHRSNEDRSAAFLAILVVLVIGVSSAAIYTFDTMAHARSVNTGIANALRRGDAGAPSSAAAGAVGFAALDQSATAAQSPAAPASTPTALEPDMKWTFPLQLFAFLAAVGLAACKHLARSYNTAVSGLRRARRWERWCTMRRDRSQAKVAMCNDAIQVARAGLVARLSQETAMLSYLFDRASEQFAVRLAERNLPSAELALPDVPDVETVIRDVLDPEANESLPLPNQLSVHRVPRPNQQLTPTPPSPDSPATHDVDPAADALRESDASADAQTRSGSSNFANGFEDPEGPQVEPFDGADLFGPTPGGYGPMMQPTADRPINVHAYDETGSVPDPGNPDAEEAGEPEAPCIKLVTEPETAAKAYSPFSAPTKPLSLGPDNARV